MVDLLCTDATKKHLLLAGGGFAHIYGPDGSPLGTNLAETEGGFVVADTDLGLISLAKAAADPSGHYSRPDVTQLLLNKTRREAVVVYTSPAAEMTEATPAAEPTAAPALSD
ncbi:hypothetical protein [Variovorax sp. MHTC-1]|uniref:hypothetical protein n=1 Tax=Variovorax sp. MHTC-1 TaxID=2495593 RepID=UPI00268EFCA8|nr:hypothetical protein [Variovorax sp. MHTC-1]